MERPDLKSVKDKSVIEYIAHLEKIAVLLLSNSRVKTYIALRRQVDNWNEQITFREEEMPNPEKPNETIKVKMGFVDLFADKDTKDFDRVFKYITEADDIEDRLAKMFEKLTPKEQEETQKTLSGSTAEKYIFKEK